MKRQSFLLFATLLASGCADQASPDVASQFRETPLRQLQGVEIGMPARQLKRLRPAARYAPLLGLQETIPGYAVSYRFSSAMGEQPDSDVSDSDKLLSVYMAELSDSEQRAVASWKVRVADVIKARRAPDLCERFAAGGQQARWFSGNMALAIGVFPPEASSAGVSARVIHGVSKIDQMKQPPGATPVACPTT